MLTTSCLSTCACCVPTSKDVRTEQEVQPAHAAALESPRADVEAETDHRRKFAISRSWSKPLYRRLESLQVSIEQGVRLRRGDLHGGRHGASLDGSGMAPADGIEPWTIGRAVVGRKAQ